MKARILSLLLLLVILCASLTSCEAVKLFNNVYDIIDRFLPNRDDPDNPLNLVVNFLIPDPNRCTEHLITVIPPIAATCTTEGRSGGQVCSKCATVIVAQDIVPKLDHEYSDSEDSICNSCGYERDIRCQHLTVEKIPAEEPTCTVRGRTEGERCLGCDKILSGYELIQVAPHTYDKEMDADCNVCGYIRKIECPHEKTEAVAKRAPTCTEVGLTEGQSCVHCGEILVVQEQIAMLPHTESEWIVDKIPTASDVGERHTECTVCATHLKSAEIAPIDQNADAAASAGLAFGINADGNSYSLIGIGHCTDTVVVIPTNYDGKPVTKIADGAFKDITDIEGVVIPEGVLHIGNGAFRGCSALVSVSIPKTATDIGEYAFFGCQSLAAITLPRGMSAIRSYAFYGCAALSVLDVPYGVMEIGEYAFFGCRSLSSILLPDTLGIIGDHAFQGIACTSLLLPNSISLIGSYAFGLIEDVGGAQGMRITLYKGIERIGAYAFSRGSVLTFKGTAGDWSDIVINPMNYNYTVNCVDITFIH